MLWCPLGKLDFFQLKGRKGVVVVLLSAKVKQVSSLFMVIALLSISLPLANNGKWPKIDPQIVGISRKRSHLATLHENETFFSDFQTLLSTHFE